jgi:hypothetical protein
MGADWAADGVGLLAMKAREARAARQSEAAMRMMGPFVTWIAADSVFVKTISAGILSSRRRARQWPPPFRYD